MIISFTRQLYVLMKAGIPLLNALQIIYAQTSAGRFKDNLGVVIENVQQGKSFSESLSSCPRQFSGFYINMIKAAEVSGNLVGILKELSAHLSMDRRISRQVQTAFMYPGLVLTTAVAILTVLMVFVIPVFTRIFEDMGGKLPPITLFLINVSKFIQHWGTLFILGLTILGALGAFIFTNTVKGRHIFNIIIWRIPLFGSILKATQIARFCRTLGTLLSSGVTLVKGLEVLADTTPAILLRQAIQDILYSVEQGDNLSLAMERTQVFPLTLVKMIQVGEESGKIAELFLEAAQDYEEEVSFSVTGFLSLLEPLLIIVMGAIVGFIVISLFFPIFTISSLVK